MISGAASAGKSAFIKSVLPLVSMRGLKSVVAKMDCIESRDGELFRSLGYESLTAISGDICPDHFLVSNLPELWQWAERRSADYLFIESAGLCHRCSPATEKAVAVCVLDGSASILSPERLGPMLLQADMIVVTRIDMISQAEREIIGYKLKGLNPSASLFFIDGREGYGAELAVEYILSREETPSYEDDVLRHTMPSGVCSYCVGEKRVGSAYQLGVVGKIDIGAVV